MSSGITQSHGTFFSRWKQDFLPKVINSICPLFTSLAHSTTPHREAKAIKCSPFASAAKPGAGLAARPLAMHRTECKRFEKRSAILAALDLKNE